MGLFDKIIRRNKAVSGSPTPGARVQTIFQEGYEPKAQGPYNKANTVEKQLETNSTLNSVLSLIEDVIGGLDYTLTDKLGNDMSKDEHAVILEKLLTGGSDSIPTANYNIMKAIVRNYLLHGEIAFYIERERDDKGSRKPGGMPTMIIPISTQEIEGTPTTNVNELGEPFWKLRVDLGDGVTATIEAPIADFVYYKVPRSKGAAFNRSDSRLKALSHELSMLENANKWQSYFFTNDATPGLVINITDPEGMPLTKEDLDAFKVAFMANHTGVNRSHVPTVTTGNVNVSKIGASQQEMGFNEFRKDIAEEIISYYRVPLEILGRTKNSNKATMTEAKAMFYEFCIQHIVDDIELAFTNALLPKLFIEEKARVIETGKPTAQEVYKALGDKKLFFKFLGVVPNQMEVALAYAEKMWNTGVISNKQFAVAVDSRIGTNFAAEINEEYWRFPKDSVIIFDKNMDSSQNINEDQKQDGGANNG